ncbi:lysosome-associated membrane glycoprotein 2 isoform X3 [Pseudophryne corroboree]|uniref:lysosome-associated membrane glycoprotein 2 isoform X3 n=1 Tax=Pseudophryne corroboree TaxID=495146 RepID=UPI003081DBA2
MDRSLYRVTLCLLGLGLLQSKAFEVKVTDGSNNTCIYANMMVNFIVQYETSNNTYENVTLPANGTVNTDGSTCGASGKAPLLNVDFGNYTWSLNFTKNEVTYSGDVITFTYNTDDAKLFPDAQRKGNLTSTVSYSEPIPLNATFKCLHREVVVAGNVTQLFWNVTLQAYAQNVTRSTDVHCSADNPTTQAPTTHLITTPNTTTTAPTPTPKPMDKPAIGNYSVSNGTETCLLASLGLQLNVSLSVETKTVWTLIDINPNNTHGSGSCGNDTAILRLNDNNHTLVEFYFSIKKKSFYLQEMNVTITNVSGITVQRAKQNLSLWEASLGNSYLCRKEQLVTVSDDLYINTFDVRVQPFSVKNATYATAEDCFADQNFTVPIVVGAALGVLVILVMVAYFIGRRNRRSAGYEHF